MGMELGGNIELIGFSEVDPNDLVIIKKIVGNYTKDLADGVDNFERISVTLTQQGPFEVVSAAVVGKETFSAKTNDNNLYFALDACLKQVLSAAGL